MGSTHLFLAEVQFSEGSLFALNLSLAFILFGIALDLKLSHFRDLVRQPWPLVVGLTSQLVALPALTLLLIVLIEPPTFMALGMLLVATCPGGNVSNFFSHHAKGNVALSIGLTTVVTLFAAVITPVNFELWSGWYLDSAAKPTLEIPFIGMLKIGALIIALPVTLGMLFAHYWPKLTHQLRPVFKILSLIIFATIVTLAVVKNWAVVLERVTDILGIVALHNGLAFALGFLLALVAGLKLADRKTITIETGIQNAGLGLVLIFNFFEGEADMALIAAMWGLWHLFTGFGLASVLRLLPNRSMVNT